MTERPLDSYVGQATVASCKRIRPNSSEILLPENFRYQLKDRRVDSRAVLTCPCDGIRMDYATTEPVREFARRRKISPTQVYRWIDNGDLESFLIGHRRHIVVASYDRLVRRLMERGPVKLPSSNPKAKARQDAAASPRPTERRQRVAQPRQQYRTAQSR